MPIFIETLSDPEDSLVRDLTEHLHREISGRPDDPEENGDPDAARAVLGPEFDGTERYEIRDAIKSALKAGKSFKIDQEGNTKHILNCVMT